MNIKTLEIAGFVPALKALHLPYNVECKSDVKALLDTSQNWVGMHTEAHVSGHDMHLLQALRKRGDEHAKVLRGIMVTVQITAPIFWFREFETYNVGRQRLSSSSTMHTDAKGLSGDELQKVKSEMPMGTEQTTIECISYQTLSRMYAQREGHRLEQWDQFREWIETLPMFEELIKPIDYEALYLEKFTKKACEWLTENHTNIDYINTDGDLFDISMVEDFKKYMKGGEQ